LTAREPSDNAGIAGPGRLFMKKPARLALPIALAALLAGCTHTAAVVEVEMKTAIDVLSEPEKATITYKGKVLGETPQSLRVQTFEDVTSITAANAGLDVIEKRIRIISSDQAQVIFRMGKGGISPIAKKLGLTRVLVFEYAEKVCFDSARSELKPEALPVLARQAEILNEYFPKAAVYVCGYTDSTGSDAFNDKLSLQRAETVRNFLVNQKVDTARIKTQGFGKQFEVASNGTAEGRALNRRTEVILPE
jgi:outer membrane protein OmpA-like peptidoglycan-associated protein